MTNIFLENAKKSLLKAEDILKNWEDDRLLYAALELRLCIESIVYSRLQKLSTDKVVDISAYLSWQPNKILDYFLSLDPYSLTDTKVSFAIGNKKYPPKKWIEFGSECKIDKNFIKQNYHKLGSFLHQRTMKNTFKEQDYHKKREDLNNILNALKQIMNSNIRNIIISKTGQFNCIECHNDITVLIPSFKLERPLSQKIKCPHNKNDNKKCNAEYSLITNNDEVTHYIPLMDKFPCTNDMCEGEIIFWKEEIGPNMKKACPECGEVYSFLLTLNKELK